jgi:hypothetical protein
VFRDQLAGDQMPIWYYMLVDCRYTRDAASTGALRKRSDAENAGKMKGQRPCVSQSLSWFEGVLRLLWWAVCAG